MSKYPSGKIPRNSKDFGKTFICRRGCNTRTATYTSEFIWEDVFHGLPEDIDSLIERVKGETKASRKNRIAKQVRDDSDEFPPQDELDDLIHTPRKKRKISAASTPRKLYTPSKLLTPSHKRYGKPYIASFIG
jgi:origin recognition complex subunit 1